MKIESLSFLTELTDEDASCVNGGCDSIFDDLIIGNPISPFPIVISPELRNILGKNFNNSNSLAADLFKRTMLGVG